MRWFGNSKITNPDRSPKICYHGTNARFRAFDPNHFGKTDEGYYGRGFYFSPTEPPAHGYGHIILPVYLKMENPFVLPCSGSSDHECLIDLREKLARLKGMPADLRPFRTIPDGYEIQWGEHENPYNPRKPLNLCSIAPKPELYGTNREIYGPEKNTELKAIVAFNDAINDINYDAGWSSSLLKLTDRDHLADILQANGHDGIIVKNPDPDLGGDEYIVFNPHQIKHATQNCGDYAPNNPNIFQ